MPPPLRPSVGLNATPRHRAGPPSSAGSNTSRPGRATTPTGGARRGASPTARGTPATEPSGFVRVTGITSANIASRLAATAHPEERARIVASAKAEEQQRLETGRPTYANDRLALLYGRRELRDPPAAGALWSDLRKHCPNLTHNEPAPLPVDVRRPVEGPGSYERTIQPQSIILKDRSAVPLPLPFVCARQDAERLPTSRVRALAPPPPFAPHRVGRARSSSPAVDVLLQQPWRRVVGDSDGTRRTERKRVEIPAKQGHIFGPDVVAEDVASAARRRSGRAHTPVERCPDGPRRAGTRSRSASEAVNDPFAVAGDEGFVTPHISRRHTEAIRQHYEMQPENRIAKPDRRVETLRAQHYKIRPQDNGCFDHETLGAKHVARLRAASPITAAAALAELADVNVVAAPQQSGSDHDARRSSITRLTTRLTPQDTKSMLSWASSPARGGGGNATTRDSVNEEGAPAGGGRRTSLGRNSPNRFSEGAKIGMSMPSSNDDAGGRSSSPSRYRRLNDPSGIAGFSQRPNGNPSPARVHVVPAAPTANLFAFGTAGRTGTASGRVSGVVTPAAPRPSTRSQSPTHRSTGVAGVFSWV